MPGIGGALDIARWSLYSSQLAIEVLSHNIANANTPGYSRQQLKVESNVPITMGPGQMGTGVKATEVTRYYDAFINEQVTLKKSKYYYWDAQNSAMEEIETIFNESDEYGLNKIMGEFWNAWSDLSNNPEGSPERESLLAKSNNLIQFIRDLDYNLREYQRHLDSSIRGSVNQINGIISQIADLNKQISSVEIDGIINANDLRDRREVLLENLAEYLDISYYEEESSGQVMVYILGGTPLVLGKDHYTIDCQRNDDTGLTDILWKDLSGRSVNVTNKLEGGRIAGWANVRDTKIGSYLDSMNSLVKELVWQVNSLHSEGVGLDPVSSLTGTVEITALTDDLGADFLFSDRFVPGGQFEIVAYDASGAVTNTYVIDPAGSTVGDLITEINTEAGAGGGEITASLNADGFFTIQANGGHTFAIKHSIGAESSNALAVMGVNTFFSWIEESGMPNDDVFDITQTLGINRELTADSSRIAAGYLDSNNRVAPGMNNVALAIYSVQDQVISNLGGTGLDTTLDAYFSSFIAEVGVDVQNASLNKKYNETLLDQYIQRKESVTGVNLDEEMADILKYQHLYQAAAKLISVCDEMMQTLLSVK
ncbi:MAG TPA: flagellar hook-associated protein FlgK [Deltaproteobacteria bacterium]|nr:flagellar hook-associated protein FlgK [Deltaproteobacteria bacterium]